MTHQLKDIAVFFDASEAGGRTLEIAARLAGQHHAHLIGICAAAATGTELTLEGFARGGAMREVIQRRESALAARLLRAGRWLDEAAARHGVHAEFRVISSTAGGSEAALQSLYCDLLVVGHPAAGAPPAWSATQMLMRTGVPIMLVPSAWTGVEVGRRIVLAWNASRQARRAIADALPLLIAAETVDLLLVDSERDGMAAGEGPGADMAAYLARHGVQVELRPIASRGAAVAEVILADAVERGADLIVFGAYSRPRLAEAVMGGVTRTLLGAGLLPLFVSR